MMRHLRKRLLRAAVMAVGLYLYGAATSQAATLAIESFSDGGGTSGSSTIGFDFVPLTDIFVTSLGFYDHGADGLDNSHIVELWDLQGVSLASTVVDTSSRLESSFRFEDIEPLRLSAGVTYVLGADLVSPQDQDQMFLKVQNLVTNGIVLGDPRTNISASHSFPVFTSAPNGPGFFGPNIEFNVVPLPAALPLFGTGLGLLGFIGWLRRRRAAAV